MRVQHSISIDRTPEEVFELISDLSRYPEFFVGITKWESRSKKKRGVGARFRVLMQVGSIEAGGTIHVTSWEPSSAITWESVQGINQSGSWVLRPHGRGTELVLTIEFDLSGGPVGSLVERIAGRIVSRNMWATLLAVRRILELEPAQA